MPESIQVRNENIHDMQTLERKVETENQWLTVARVALAWTGTLKMMYLKKIQNS
jgi:hypothetical protein